MGKIFTKYSKKNEETSKIIFKRKIMINTCKSPTSIRVLHKLSIGNGRATVKKRRDSYVGSKVKEKAGGDIRSSKLRGSSIPSRNQTRSVPKATFSSNYL